MEININLDTKKSSFSLINNVFDNNFYLNFRGKEDISNISFVSQLFLNNQMEEESFSNNQPEDSSLKDILLLPSGSDIKRFLLRNPSLIPDETYNLKVIVSGYTDSDVEIDTLFTVPVPEKPLPSWVWNEAEKIWQPPVPMPEDGNDYEWLEDSQEWFLVPESPYPSWQWNSEDLSWMPPDPEPIDESQTYLWDEETISWMPVENS